MNLTSILAIVSVIPSVLSTVRQLVEWAEAGFSGSGRGSEKKEYVFGGLKEWARWMSFFSTGGQKETWSEVYNNFDAFSGALSSIIDTVVAFTVNRDKK